MALSVAKCLDDDVFNGRLTRAQADRAIAEVRKIMEESGANEGQAAARAADVLTREAALAQRQTALQVLAWDRVLNDVAAHPDGTAAGVAAIFARDLKGKLNPSSVESKTAALRGLMNSKFAEGLDAYRSTALGFRRDTAGLLRFVRELYGEATGSAVDANAAKAWRSTTDWAVAQFGAARGGDIRLESWRLPQNWDSAKVKAAGQQTFSDFMHSEVAAGRLRIADWETGLAVDPLRRAEIISHAWERISTDGLSDLVPGQAGGTKLGNARSERRAFEWTNADAYLGFNERFGAGDAGLFDLLVNHIDGMARDIALLERLGPNPAASARAAIDLARKASAGGGMWADLKIHHLESLWHHVSGAASTPVSETLARYGGNTRAILSSAQLGSATLSAVTDFGTLRQTAAWNGLSVVGMMREYTGQMNPANAADRLLAVRMALGADSWARTGQAAMRMTMEEMGNTLPNRMADTVMRASLLAPHTQALKNAFGMEFMGALGEAAGRTFGDLDPPIRQTMERYGIGAWEWERIRTAGLFDDRGVKFIMPEQMTRTGDRADLNAAVRLLEMVNTERGFAVLEPGAAERAIMLGKTQAGTPWGEFARFVMQYKSFPVTMITRHGMRGASLGAAGFGAYMASFGVTMTLLGAFTMQMKQIAYGRDPRDMNDWRFWGAAAAQGGAIGIYGDFLNGSLTRADRSFAMTMLGPGFGLVDDLMKLTGANITATVAGRDAHFGREMAQFVRRNTPGTSLWYGRLALDRLMWDRLQMLSDPDYAQAFRRTEDRALRENNQRFWWGPGDAAPERAPAMGRAIGMDAR